MSDDPQATREEVQRVAYRLLSRRDHARTELVRKLRDRKLPRELIEQVVDDLQQAGYVDDRQFALDQGAILARKQWGPNRIRQKLRDRGIADALVDQTLQQLAGQFDFPEMAFERLESKFGPPDQLDDRARQKAFRHLRHRGYAPGLIRRLLFDGGL